MMNEEKTWRLFKSYAMHSSSGVMDYLPMTQLTLMLRECAIFSLKKETGKISSCELHSICCSARKKMKAIDIQTSKISYPVFRAILMDIASKLYSEMPSDSAMEYLINVHLCKCSKQSARTNIDSDLEVLKPIMDVFRDSFQQIYKHYAFQTQIRLHKATSPKKISSRVPLKSQLQQPSIRPVYDAPPVEKSDMNMGYDEFLHFGASYGLLSRFGVSHMRFAKIYIDCTRLTGHQVRRFTFESFYESIVHVAKAYFSKSQEPVESKFKALLMVMFHEIRTLYQAKQQSQLSSIERENAQLKLKHGTYGTTSFLGCNHFINSFYTMWKDETFVDYLTVQLS